jgi:hypothetical protein
VQSSPSFLYEKINLQIERLVIGLAGSLNLADVNVADEMH